MHRPNHPVIIREGTVSDIREITDLGVLFFEESNFRHLNYDPVKFEKLMTGALESGELFIDVAESAGHIVGFSIWGYDSYYTVETLASLFLFYVYPPFRKTAVARDLIETSTERSKAGGAAVFYAASTAGISTAVDAKMENMLVKQGFELLGKFGRKIL